MRTIVRWMCLVTLALVAGVGRADAATLHPVQTLADLRGGAPILTSPDGAQLYVVDRTLGVYAFDRNATTGELVLIDNEPPGLCNGGTTPGAPCTDSFDCGGLGQCSRLIRNPSSATISPDGQCLYIGNGIFTRAIIALSRAGDGSVALEDVYRDDSCIAGTVGAACAADAECDTSVGAGDGRCLTGLGDPEGLAVSPDSTHLYVASNYTNSIFAFARGPGCGLSLVQRVENGVGGITGLRQAWRVLVDATGGHVYAVGLFGNGLVVFDRNPLTGALTEKQTLIGATCTVGRVGEPCRSDLDCSPNSPPVDGDGVCTVTIPGLVGPGALAFNGDQTQLYVGHIAGVALFGRDPMTGMVTLIDDGVVDPPLGTSGVIFLALTPDGTTAFAGSSDIWSYDRDVATGLLRPFQVTKVSQHLALSPDGAFLYGASNRVTAWAVTPALTCAATPLAGCRLPFKPGKAQIQIRDASPDKNDRIVWKWTSGSTTSVTDFGDPTVATSYALCVYDASGSGTPRLGLRLPGDGQCKDGSPCWIQKSQLQYSNKTRIPDGIEKAALKPGEDGKAKIQVQGKDSRLRMPALGFTLPVTVQLQSESGVCWEAHYGAAKKNDAEELKAKAD